MNNQIILYLLSFYELICKMFKNHKQMFTNSPHFGFPLLILVFLFLCVGVTQDPSRFNDSLGGLTRLSMQSYSQL